MGLALRVGVLGRCWPFLLGVGALPVGLVIPSWVVVGPSFSGLELVLPVSFAVPSLGIGVGPSFSWCEGWPTVLAVGVAPSGRGWPFFLLCLWLASFLW